MKKLVFFYLFGLALVTGIFGQKTAQMQFAFKDFDGLIASSGYDIYVEKGDNYSITIIVDAEHAERIKVSVSGGVLSLGVESELFKKIKTLKAYITMPRLSSVTLSSGCDLASSDTFVTETFKAILSSGSDMNINIRAEKVHVTMSSGSNLKMNVETTELSLTSSSGSDAKLTGKAIEASFTTSSGSDVDAGDLIAHDVTIVASGGSDVNAHAEKTLTATASGGSDVVYSGNPTVTSNSSGSSSIKKKR